LVKFEELNWDNLPFELLPTDSNENSYSKIFQKKILVAKKMTKQEDSPTKKLAPNFSWLKDEDLQLSVEDIQLFIYQDYNWVHVCEGEVHIWKGKMDDTSYKLRVCDHVTKEVTDIWIIINI
jgi:hypothetical protein